MENYTTNLVPVSEWKWYLYKVTYKSDWPHVEDKVKYFVCNAAHIVAELQYCWPGDKWQHYDWETIDQVSRPRQIGRLYDIRVDEDGETAGRREAKKRGLI